MSSGQTTEDDTAGLKPLNKSLEEESIGKVVLPIMHFKQIQYFQETSPFSSNAPTRSPSPRRKSRLPPVDEPAAEDKQDQTHAGEEEKCPKGADILEEPTRKMEEFAAGGLAITDKQEHEGSVETPQLPTLSPSTQSFAPCTILAKVSDQQHLPRPKDLPLATPGDVQQIHPSPVPTRATVSPRQVKTPVRPVPKAFQPPAITGVAHLERPHVLQSSAAVASPIGTYLPPGPPPGPPLGPPGPQPGTKLPVTFPLEATKGTTALLPMGSPPVPKSIDPVMQRPASSPVDTSKPISPASQAAWRKNVLWANHSPYGNRGVCERPPSAAAGPAPVATVQQVQPKSSAATPMPSPPVSSGKELHGTGVSPRPPSGRPLATPASSGHQPNGVGKTPSGMQPQGGLPPPKAASSSSSGPVPAQSSSSCPARSSTAGVEDEYEMYSYTGSSRSSSPERKRRSRSNSSSRSSYARSCSPNSRKRGNDFLPDISVQCTPRAETAPQSLGTNQDRQDGDGLQNEQTLQASKGDAKETQEIQKPESTWRLVCGLEKIWCLSTLHFANLRVTCSQPKCFTVIDGLVALCFMFCKLATAWEHHGIRPDPSLTISQQRQTYGIWSC